MTDKFMVKVENYKSPPSTPLRTFQTESEANLLVEQTLTQPTTLLHRLCSRSYTRALEGPQTPEST